MCCRQRVWFNTGYNSCGTCVALFLVSAFQSFHLRILYFWFFLFFSIISEFLLFFLFVVCFSGRIFYCSIFLFRLLCLLFTVCLDGGCFVSCRNRFWVANFPFSLLYIILYFNFVIFLFRSRYFENILSFYCFFCNFHIFVAFDRFVNLLCCYV